jgi:DNA-binding transcriptional regulator YiaG
MNDSVQIETGEEGSRVSALRAARHRAGIRAAEAAVAVEVTVDTLFGWERGERKVPLAAAAKLLRLYQQTAPDLSLADLVEPEEARS